VTSRLVLLHTAQGQIASFDRLLAELAPGVQARHLVCEDFLAEARRDGVTDGLTRRVVDAVLDAASERGSFVLCTCSTIGAAAERANVVQPGVALRIDRPMAERAVTLGPRIAIAAALESTLGPTRALLEEVARAAGRTVELSEILCADAWPLFERGDIAAYHAKIAAALDERAGDVAVVVLAQASMAGAESLCRRVAAPVLSSPRIGLEAALERMGRPSS
jgi:hypothetical protein